MNKRTNKPVPHMSSDLPQHRLERIYGRFLLSDGISIDTRTLRPNNLFFALPGTHQDGHRFVQQALDQGASFAVVSDSSFAQHPKCIQVEDVTTTLQALAQLHRSKYKRILIGITGSNGKTTTKELLRLVLAKKYIVHATQSNQNNHLGVPLTLLHLIPQTEVAIIELGTSAPGEIAQLCQMAQPTHGLITHIGLAHTEQLASTAGVLDEKYELVQYLTQTQGVFYLNTQEQQLAARIQHTNHTPTLHTFGSLKDDYAIRARAVHPHIAYVLPDGTPGTSPLFGQHNFMNIAAAAAVGLDLGIPSHDIIEAIAAYTPANNRSECRTIGPHTLLLDAYNANPDGMSAALDSLLHYETPKGVVLGDMLELGRHSKPAHAALGTQLSQAPLDYIILVGKEMTAAKTQCPKAQHFDSITKAIQYMRQLLRQAPPSTWLLKGSRGMTIEHALTAFE